MPSPLRHATQVPDLTARELASYGPMVARVSRALSELSAGLAFRGARVARVHSHLWGDGGAHLHQWFFPRPYGYADLLGSTLVEWEETLPRAEQGQVLAAAADLRQRLTR